MSSLLIPGHLTMHLAKLDWFIIGGYFLVTLAVGLLVSRRAGSSASSFFLSGRNMPWWLLGFSMVATTFSTDTPNLVTDIVRKGGVGGNWAWWAFLLTGMLTVFVYAKLWRRSEVLTDVEFYELRYSGAPAAFLRGFRAIYLGLFFNVLIMASVTLAAIKIGGVMLGLEPWKIVVIAGTVTVIFSAAGGLSAVLVTDLLLFCTAMVGSVAAAVVAVNHPDVGGLENLIAHPNLEGKLDILPSFKNPDVFVPLLLIPVAVQWWSVWYPGSEPGGGGYVAQRMLAAKNEGNAVGATLLFNCAHYALRPWPWILVALASLVVFPDLQSLRDQFPNIPEQVLKDDLAYSAMLTFLPTGLLGIVVASLAAAYMSTISTQLNWGSSYLVNDFWKRFVRPDASEKELVTIGRVSTVVIMVLAGLLALKLENALGAFNIMLQVGAGTGLLFILRWFWWRLNAISEIVAMAVSFAMALILQFGITPQLLGETTTLHVGSLTLIENGVLAGWVNMVVGVTVTTVAWLIATLVTRPTDEQTLRRFYRLTTPGGPGWRPIVQRAAAAGEPIDSTGAAWTVPTGILCMLLACTAVYTTLFATGYVIYGQYFVAAIFATVAIGSTVLCMLAWFSMSKKEKALGR